MANDINIRVGVQNNVKAGMDGVVKDVNNRAKQMSGGMSGAFRNILGAVGFASIASGIRNLIADISGLKDAAAQVDFSPRNFQILKAVAEDAGVGADTLAGGLGRLAKAQSEVSSNKQVQQAFEALGLSLDDVISSNPEQLLQRIAAGFAATGDKAAVFDIFGRGATRLLPVLRELSGGFDKISDRGDIISDKDLNNIDALDDKLNKVTRTLKSWGALAVGGAVSWVEKIAARLGAMSAGGTPEEGDRAAAAEEEERARKAEQDARDKAAADEHFAAKQRAALEIQRRIDPLEAANNEIEQRGKEREAKALENNILRQKWEEEAKGARFDPGTIGRMMGQGGRDMQGQADYLTRTALDDDFRREERQKQRQIDRAQRRSDRLVKLASEARDRFAAREGGMFGSTPEEAAKWRRANPRLARVLDADKAQEAAKANRENLEQLQKAAAQATIDAAKDTMKIRDNTAAIKELRDELKLGA